MGLLGALKKKLRPPMEEIEAQRQRNYERIAKRLDFDMASAERQEALAQKKADIAKKRAHARELTPKPMQPAGSLVHDPTKGIEDALNFNPFSPSKKKDEEKK